MPPASQYIRFYLGTAIDRKLVSALLGPAWFLSTSLIVTLALLSHQ